jgi:hypothetical protein
MARYRNYDEDYEGDTWADGFSAGKRTERLSREYRDQHDRPRSAHGIGWAMVMLMALGLAGFLAFLWPDIAPRFASTAPAAPSGAVGNQAPPAAVRRAPAAPAAPAGANYASPIPGLAQNQATADAQYNAAIQAGEQHAASTPAPLPLNSAGEPIIDQAQADQQQLSLQLAEQEGAAAADQQLAAQRATANADALSRPPDVSKQDAEQMMHRDLCSVPRANPATCGQGLYKPTPVQ